MTEQRWCPTEEIVVTAINTVTIVTVITIVTITVGFYTDGKFIKCSGMNGMKRLPGLVADSKTWQCGRVLACMVNFCVCSVVKYHIYISCTSMVSNLEDTSSCVSLKANIQMSLLYFILITFRHMLGEPIRSAGLTEIFAHL